jgi:hypothetical protein
VAGELAAPRGVQDGGDQEADVVLVVDAGDGVAEAVQRTPLRSLKEALDTTTSGGRLVFHVFAALAEFIREYVPELKVGGDTQAIE